MAVTVWSAWAVCLAALTSPAGPLMAQEKPAEKCVFEGIARNSVTRLGVSKAAIHLIPMNGAAAYEGATNAAGVFHFEGVIAGDYRLEAMRTGYSKSVLADKSGHAIPTLHLAPGQTMAGNDLWFTPESGISGRVIGQDGEPIPGAHITVIAQKWRNGKRVYQGASTQLADDAGVYHSAAIPPGRYFVYAERPDQGPLAFSILEAPGKPEMRLAGRYHPDSPGLDGAAAIDLGPGEEISGIDFRLPLVSVFHLTGIAQLHDSSEGGSVTLKRRYNDQMLDWEGERASIAKDGTFDVAGVKPGSYFLYSSQSVLSNQVTSSKVPVTMTANDSAVVAPPVARFELQGRIRVEGGSAGEIVPVQVFCEGGDADDFTTYQRHAEPKADGTFAIPNLTPDRYTIRIANLDRGKEEGYYLKSVRVNGVAALGAEIDLTKGPPEEVELILSGAVGSAEGTVRWPEEGSNNQTVPDPAAELTILMIPEKVASGDTRTLATYLDQDGHFRLTDLEPGSYRAFAVTNYDKGLWQNAEFLRQMAGRGIALEVSEKGNTRIEVPVLRPADIRQVEERIQ